MQEEGVYVTLTDPQPASQWDSEENSNLDMHALIGPKQPDPTSDSALPSALRHWGAFFALALGGTTVFMAVPVCHGGVGGLQ